VLAEGTAYADLTNARQAKVLAASVDSARQRTAPM
jgi:hypothetical protein